MSNHQAIVAAITDIIPIEGADKIQIAKVLGENVIVSKDLQVGYVGLFFPVGVQLSADFCKHNNLYRHKEMNADTTKAGFFEDKRVVRAQPFMKVKSEGYFTSLDSLSYVKGFALLEFPLGFSFDELGGEKICQKYISKATREAMEKAQKNSRVKKVKAEAPFFLKHVDSAQFKHSANLIEKGSLLSFHNKVHGTSFRVGKQLTITPAKGWKATINNLFGKEIFKPTQEYKLVVGTRNVILDAPEKEGFHGSESFRFDVAKQLEPHLGDGVSVYGEIAGFANSKPIMAVHSSAALKDKAFTTKFGKDITYKYGCNEAEMRWHIYRITITTADGTTTDLTDAQVKEWAKQRGFIATLDVAPPVVYDGNVRDLQDKVEKLTEGGSDGMGADWIDPSHPTEGIIIRVDNGGMTPKFYKSKSFHFRAMEHLVEVADLEDMS